MLWTPKWRQWYVLTNSHVAVCIYIYGKLSVICGPIDPLCKTTGIGAYINMKFNTKIGNLMPLQSSDELLPLRSLDKIKSLVNQGSSASDIPVFVYVLASLAFIALYYYVARRKMLQSDL